MQFCVLSSFKKIKEQPKLWVVDLTSTSPKDCEYSDTSVPWSPCVSSLISNPPYTSYEIKMHCDLFKQEQKTKKSIFYMSS